ncbi:MAG: hypothetical protein AAF688_10920, partial [Bacteroidota bacterium]
MIFILITFKALSIGLVYALDYLGVFTKPVNLNRIGFDNLSKIETLLFTSVFAPIVEELAFRLPLRVSKWGICIGSIGFSFILCKVLIELNWLYSGFSSLLVGVLILSSLSKINLQRLKSFWRSNRKLIFYSSLLVFSFLHLKNYQLTFELFLFSPIILLPRFLGGLVFSYVRF